MRCACTNWCATHNTVMHMPAIMLWQGAALKLRPMVPWPRRCSKAVRDTTRYLYREDVAHVDGLCEQEHIKCLACFFIRPLRQYKSLCRLLLRPCSSAVGFVQRKAAIQRDNHVHSDGACSDVVTRLSGPALSLCPTTKQGEP